MDEDLKNKKFYALGIGCYTYWELKYVFSKNQIEYNTIFKSYGKINSKLMNPVLFFSENPRRFYDIYVDPANWIECNISNPLIKEERDFREIEPDNDKTYLINPKLNLMYGHYSKLKKSIYPSSQKLKELLDILYTNIQNYIFVFSYAFNKENKRILAYVTFDEINQMIFNFKKNLNCDTSKNFILIGSSKDNENIQKIDADVQHILIDRSGYITSDNMYHHHEYFAYLKLKEEMDMIDEK